MRTVLHILDHSLPEHDGYSFRSHSVLTQLKQFRLKIDVITGPKHGPVANAMDTIDGIEYLRTAIEEGVSTSGVAGQLRTITMTRRRISDYLKTHPANIIHAHSPCLNGLAALGLGLPVVYEMRSSWEDASVSVGTTKEGSLRYRLSRMLETYVVKRANAVVVICEGLKNELIRRGISEEKVTVVPNALPENLFTKPDADSVAAVKARFKLNNSSIIGFFGSFFEWEGVDSLVRALPLILHSVPNARLLIAGGGRQAAALHDLVAELGLGERVVFAGRVPHDDISACYAAADVMAYPRLPDRLTEMVTPLKPLEAMAQSTLVVASDVGGHKELVADGDTGILFDAGNHEDLARKIVEVLSQPQRVHDIKARALDYVKNEKRWSAVVERYLPIYESLTDRRKA